MRCTKDDKCRLLAINYEHSQKKLQNICQNVNLVYQEIIAELADLNIPADSFSQDEFIKLQQNIKDDQFIFEREWQGFNSFLNNQRKVHMKHYYVSQFNKDCHIKK